MVRFVHADFARTWDLELRDPAPALVLDRRLVPRAKARSAIPAAAARAPVFHEVVGGIILLEAASG
jgi:hypothetical protein